MKNEKVNLEKEKKKMSFLVVINKRDEIYELINSSNAYFRKYLAKKIDAKWELRSKKIDNSYKIFEEDFKVVLANVNSLKNKILKKRDQFIDYINIYSLFLSKNMEQKLSEKFMKINEEFKKTLNISHKRFNKINDENTKIIEKKMNFEKITKSKIENIRKSITNEDRFNLDINNEEIKILLKEYKEFIRNIITLELEKNEKELKTISNQMKKDENINIENTYNVSAELKKQLKNDLKRIANYEKEVVIKVINFQDKLEDVVNFYYDQSAKYKILFKKKRIIKLNLSEEIFKDINLLFSQMANTEKLFDSINFSVNNIKNKIEVKNNSKLLKLQSNIVGDSESTKTILLENNNVNWKEV